MDERSRGEFVAALIGSIRTRTDATNHLLSRTLLQRAWPGGAGDRSEPVALGWVRRWGPHGRPPILPVCSCAGGRCGVCN